jgi:hypothetical protein
MSGLDYQSEATRKLIQTGLAGRPGKLLYSGFEALCPGSIYLLGYNPGGEPDHETAPILSHVASETSTTRNEYLDAAWETRTRGFSAGKAHLQKRVQYLLAGLSLEIRSVCASNLIFVRSKSAQHLETPQQLAEQCWPVHQFILNIVQPDCIVSFDKKVWEFILKYARNPSPIECIPAGHGNWTCLFSRISLDGKSMGLISLPHLSRYAIDHHPEVISWVRTKLPVGRTVHRASPGRL